MWLKEKQTYGFHRITYQKEAAANVAPRLLQDTAKVNS